MKRLTVITAVVLALAAATTALAAGGPGKFETKLTGKGADTLHGKLDGTWTIDFPTAPTGTVGLTWNGQSAGRKGHYVISGSTITLTPKPGGTCKTKGIYTFKVAGDTLTFTKVSDTCANRRDVLVAHPWKRIG